MPTDLPPWVSTRRREIGQRIRRHREHQGFSQEVLADRAGLSRQTIYRAELGTHGISLDALFRIADALAVPDWQLFRDE